MQGDAGADTYLIAKADGKDEIYNYDTDKSVDIVKFTDVALIDLTSINKDVNSLLMTYGTTSKLTVDNYFSGIAYQVNQFQFAGGDTLDNFTVGTIGKDTLNGTAKNDALNGLGNADIMNGGTGDDLYFVNHTQDGVTEAENAGKDTVLADISYTLTDNVENLALLSGAETGTGNGIDNTLTGNESVNTLSGLGGNDSLNGKNGADIMKGGMGDDSYVADDSADSVIELLGEGVDTVSASISFLLADHVENLLLLGKAAINGTGNDLVNNLVGNAANNVLDGGINADTLQGGLDDDSYVVDDSGDTVTELVSEGTDSVSSSISLTLFDNVENLTLTGTAAINGTGNGLVNSLVGNSAANVLDGGAGADAMSGGLGNDSYVVDDVGDIVSETSALATEIDQVNASISITLGDNLENLTLVGSANIDGIGNKLNNVLLGNSGNNTLNGGTGKDTMAGSLGDDLYLVDNIGDLVQEGVGAGMDTVRTGLAYSLGEHLENLILTGSAAIKGTGNSLANALTGNTGANLLDGGFGADVMKGDLGNDSYVVDNSGDTVTETSTLLTEIDQVLASVSFALGSNIENLTLTGTDVINGTGNTLSNVLIGNSAANLLDGGKGSDTLTGGAGDDVYTVDDVGDSITELLGEGFDSVVSSVSYTLGDNLEKLTLTTNAKINATGNALDNTLIGNNAANKLNGGKGLDSMIGGNGNDVYTVDNTGDSITELAGQGVDSVSSAVSYTLGDNLENLSLIGNKAIDGIGNSLNNSLKGNSAANTLSGDAGADSLSGADGADTLTGGLGKDKIILTETTAATDKVVVAAGDSLLSAYDTVTGFKLTDGVATAGIDQLALSGTLIAADVLAQDGVNAGAFRSHHIASGIISFDNADSYSTALTLSAKNVGAAFNYLQANFSAGETVAFTAVGNTYVFQDNGVTDTAVQLTGVLASNLDTDGLEAGGVWLV